MRFNEQERRSDESVIKFSIDLADKAPKAPEKDSKEPSVIEKLRATHPNDDLVIVAVAELTDPAEMKRFVFEYANDLRQNSPFRDSQRYPLEWAAGIIMGTADILGGESIERWDELLETGTLRNPPDTSMDWLSKSGNQARAEERERERGKRLRPQKRPGTVIEFSRIQRNASGQPLVSARSAAAQSPKR